MTLGDIGLILIEWPEIPRSTIRQWASDGKLQRRGSDNRGRTLYDMAEAEELAKKHRPRAPR